MKVRIVATALVEEALGHAAPELVEATIREIEAQAANGPATPSTAFEHAVAQVLEARTPDLLERIGQAVALADVPRSTARH